MYRLITGSGIGNGSLMMKGGHGQTNQLHDINWGAVHASHALILNYYVCVCVHGVVDKI